MLQATGRKTKREKVSRFPGICRDAEELGVERTHLYRVLTGQRASKRLLAAYRALKARQQKGGRA